MCTLALPLRPGTPVRDTHLGQGSPKASRWPLLGGKVGKQVAKASLVTGSIHSYHPSCTAAAVSV